MPVKDRVFDKLGVLVVIGLYAAFYVIAPIQSSKWVGNTHMHLLTGSLTIALARGLLDVINENYGKDSARKLVLAAMIVRFVAWGWVGLTILMPTFRQAPGYEKIMTQGLRILIAGEAALFIGQYFIDVQIFHWVKKLKWGFWLRYNISNMISASFGATLFMVLAFYGTGKPIWTLIWSSILWKIVVVSWLLTPVFSGLARVVKK